MIRRIGQFRYESARIRGSRFRIGGWNQLNLLRIWPKSWELAGIGSGRIGWYDLIPADSWAWKNLKKIWNCRQHLAVVQEIECCRRRDVVGGIGCYFCRDQVSGKIKEERGHHRRGEIRCCHSCCHCIFLLLLFMVNSTAVGLFTVNRNSNFFFFWIFFTIWILFAIFVLSSFSSC